MAKGMSLKEYDAALKKKVEEKSMVENTTLDMLSEDSPKVKVIPSNDDEDEKEKKALAPLRPESAVLRRANTMAGKITGKDDGLDYTVGEMGSSIETGNRFNGTDGAGFSQGDGSKMNANASKKNGNLGKRAKEFLGKVKGAVGSFANDYTSDARDLGVGLGLVRNPGLEGALKTKRDLLLASAQNQIKTFGTVNQDTQKDLFDTEVALAKVNQPETITGAVGQAARGVYDVGAGVVGYLGSTNPVTGGNAPPRLLSGLGQDIREVSLRDAAEARMQGRVSLPAGADQSVGGFARRVTGSPSQGIWQNGIGNNLWRAAPPAGGERTLIRQLIAPPDEAQRKVLALQLGSLSDRLARARIAAATFADKAERAIKPKEQEKLMGQASEANAAAEGLSLAIRELQPKREQTLTNQLVSQARNRIGTGYGARSFPTPRVSLVGTRSPLNGGFGSNVFRSQPRVPQVPQGVMNPQTVTVLAPAPVVEVSKAEQNYVAAVLEEPAPQKPNRLPSLKGFSRLGDRSKFGNPNQQALQAQSVGVNANPNRRMTFGKFGLKR